MPPSSTDYTVKFQPISRNPDDTKKYGLIGRWHWGASLTGDATGGDYLFSCYMGLTRGLFPSPMLGDIRYFSCYDQNGNLGAGYILLNLQTGDFNFGNGASQLRRTISYTSSAIAITQCYYNPFPPFIFGFNRESPTILVVTVGPNTNGHTLDLYAGGYVYDERYTECNAI